MPEDMSSEQTDDQTTTDEMSQEEQEKFFDEIDEEGAGAEEEKVDEDEEEIDGDDEDGDDSDDEDVEEDGDDDDEDDEDDEEDDEDEDDDSKETSAAAELKKLIAEQKKQKQTVDVDTTVEQRVKEREEQIRQEVRDEILGATEVVGPDGEKIDLDEMRETYGELFQGLEAMAFQLATQMQAKALESGEFVRKADFDKAQQETAKDRFISALEKRHPDLEVSKIEGNDSHPFWEWFDNQDQDVQDLFNSGTVDNVSGCLAAFKEASVRAGNKKRDKVTAAKKKKHANLHKTTSRTERKARASSKKSGKDRPMTPQEQEKVFDEYEVD